MVSNNEKQKLHIKGAGLIMEQLYVTGVIQNYHQLQNDLDTLKNILKSRLPNPDDRLEYVDQKLVAKYQTDCKYETDIIGLNRFLDDLNLLVHVAKIDYKDLKKNDPAILKRIDLFKDPIEQYAKMNPNKLGAVNVTNTDYSGLSDYEVIRLWSSTKRKLEMTKQAIEESRKEMLTCPILKSERILSSSFGSVSLIDKDPTYDIGQIYDFMGSNFLIRYSKPDFKTILMDLIPNGQLTYEDLQRFRCVKSIGMKFTITNLEETENGGEIA